MVFLKIIEGDESKREVDISSITLKVLKNYARLNNISLVGCAGSREKIIERFEKCLPTDNTRLFNILDKWKENRQDEIRSKREICLYIYCEILNYNREADEEAIKV